MDNTLVFDQLLQAAAAQPDPQRLLFVFAAAELPDDATPAQRERFAAGEGGSLTPMMCIDKGLDQLTDFGALVAESEEAGPPWQVMFAAGLAGHDGQPPTEAQIEHALQSMAERVRAGMVESLLALDRQGEALSFA
ncbi:ribonucleotide reductase subunit alpha [Methylibium sp.]|uniref:ribonucleotide reductase subunit alpha n=1 Tax=Methylibium sp. TaxID=2067992 RepID=UPI0017E004E7|nr:ribonucleotide reductase subunit alpha [Methylibium sp.]MBA3588592.1 ribonucleotide reductase subunit alpha [Methylibium sp.]